MSLTVPIIKQMKCINFYIVLLLVFSLIIINQSNESKDLYFFGNDYEPVIPRKLMYTEPTALDLTLFKNTIPGFSTSDIRSISMSNNKYLATIITNGKLFISGFHSRYTFFNETCKDSKERPYYIESLAPYEPIKQASVSTDWVSFVDKNDNIWMYSSYDKNALQRVTGQYDPVTHGSITDIKNYGYNNFVAKTSTGFVIGWKFDDPIQTTVIVIPLDVKKIVCGADHCLALTHIKTVYSWGDNGVGQLGVPSSVLGTTSTPIVIFENDTVIDIAAGTYFSMVLTSNYSLYGFGSNLDNHFYIDSQYTYVENEINYLNPMIGFLNNTINVTRIYTSGFNKAAFDASSNIHLWTLSYLQYNRAVRKENAVGVITAFNSTNSQEGNILLFELGDEVFLATTSTNIHGWGRNSYSQIGTGEINYRCALYPVGNRLQINTQNLTRISSGGVVFLVQEGDKQLKAWGQNLEILIGNPAVYYNYSVFEPVSVLDNLTSTVSSLGISRTSFVGLKDGSVYYWGINNYNQAGNASFQLLEPTQTFTNRFEFVMASTSHSCGKDLRGGQIFCWGRFDALGDGVTYPYWIAGVADPSPVAFDTPMPNIIKLSVGHGFTIALSNTSEVYTWGRNQHYNIGDGTKVTRTTPYWLTSLSGKNIIQVYALYTISFALSGEGKVYYWGRLTYEGREILFSTTPTLLNNIPNNRRIKKISGYDNLIILVSTRDEIFYISPLFPQFRQLEPQTRNMKVLDVSASGNTALVYAETDVCPSGYYPYPTCDSYDCFGLNYTNPAVCSAHGTCVEPDFCECKFGWEGNNCQSQYFVCNGTRMDNSSVCSGNGKCVNNDKCECNFGYTGSNCEQLVTCFGLPALVSTVCSAHGTCVSMDNCNCTNGWGSSNCSVPICSGTDGGCSGNGVCTAPETCNCKRGYTGKYCTIPICFDTPANETNVCYGHGLCIGIDNCNCTTGWGSANCSLPVCYGDYGDAACSGNGRCVSPNSCHCNDNNVYTGSNCSIPVCFGVAANNQSTCNGQGTCISPNTCRCSSSFEGNNCEIPIIAPIASLDVISSFAEYNSLCDTQALVTLDASKSTYTTGHNSFITYTFSVNQKRGGAVVNVLKQTVSASTLLLNLLPYGNGDYTFNVTVSDIKANLQGDTVSSKAISIVSPFNITMSVNGLPSLVANNVLRTSENVLSASVSSTCGNLNTNLFSFNWLLTGSDSSNLPAGTSNTLVIPTKTFQSIKSIYMAEVTVSFQTVTNSKTISLYTFPQNAFLQLLGGNRSISITESATLTSTLVDLDELAVTPTYSWSCVLSSGLPCPASLNNVATSSLTIPANTFLDADVAYFTLTTTIGSVKSVSSVVFLQLEKLKLPTLIVNKYDLYVSKFKDILFRVNVIPSDSESTLTFDWTLIEGSPLIDLQKISIAGTDKQDFGIAASTGNFNNLLVEGNEYTLQLNVTQTNGRLKQTVSAFSRITFKVNQSPNAGNLLISPSNGTATLTEFTLSADSFVDPDQPNTPLSYAFGYYKVNDNKLKEKIILVDYSGNILGKTKLPLGNNNNNDETIEVFVVARDSYGGETLVSKVINLVDPTKALSTDQITKLVQQQLNITTGVNDVLLASSLLNTNTPTPTDNTFCGQDNKCSGNGNCDLVLKKCNCNALFTGTYCQLTVVEKVQRETVRDQLLDNVIKSSTENGNLTTTSTKTILQTVESIITKTDEVNTNTVKKALTYTSTVFTTSKQQVDLTDQVLKVVSNVISTVVSNPTVNTTDINDAIRQTLKDVATQQVTNMIQGQVKTVTLPQITQTIVKDTVTTIITNTPKDQKYKLPTKLKEVLNPNNIISLETTFIGNQNIFTNEKNVSSNVFRMNIFSNDQQLLISNLTDTILFNLTVSNGIILENENLTFICQYFNESTKQLSSEGVEAKRIITLGNETIVECSTSHLTDFVIAKTTSLNKKIIPVQSSNPPRNISPKKTPLISYSSNVNYYISLLWFMVVYGIYILM